LSALIVYDGLPQAVGEAGIVWDDNSTALEGRRTLTDAKANLELLKSPIQIDDSMAPFFRQAGSLSRDQINSLDRVAFGSS
jgi:hypothetical protein